jgi:ubiquinone biosynthesis protein
VAVVVPCRWRQSADAPTRDGILKILKPGVADRLEEELEILVALADHLDAMRDAEDLPEIDHRSVFTTVRDLLRSEVRPEQEQRHLAEAAAVYAHDPRVLVPAVLPFSTPTVTAMERVYGRRVTETTGASAVVMAETVIRALVAAPVFAASRSALFHADPHAGNLFATEDGRLALLDWSLVGRLDKDARVAMAGVMLAALRQDAADVATHILAAAVRGPAPEALAETVARSLAEIRCGRLPGPGWLVSLLDAVVARGVHFPPDLMLFRKVLLTLRGVVSDIDPACSLDAVFLGAGVRTLMAEWPQRWMASPFSRAFGTHASNMDLMQAMGAAPLALMPTWCAAWGWPHMSGSRVS